MKISFISIIFQSFWKGNDISRGARREVMKEASPAPKPKKLL